MQDNIIQLLNVAPFTPDIEVTDLLPPKPYVEPNIEDLGVKTVYYAFYCIVYYDYWRVKISTEVLSTTNPVSYLTNSFDNSFKITLASLSFQLLNYKF